MTDLGTLGGTTSLGFAINNAGQVIGYSFIGDVPHAFMTGPNGTNMTDLGTLGGRSSWATDINNAGQVAGYSAIAGDADIHAFITGRNGSGMIDLGTLGGPDSLAQDINRAGQVVGWSHVAGGDGHAFVTGPDGIGMTDLNALVKLPENDFLYEAWAINDRGQIVANAPSGAYLLSPLAVPEPRRACSYF